jgi:hypothetical protein
MKIFVNKQLFVTSFVSSVRSIQYIEKA